ncbi:hypothetical protein, partial [Streptomyces silvensis]|uniref:hypothetical protein n=1 Tax=Streptomyces silvensis TaxID=1765722 RepID=UPI001A7E0F5F
VLAFPTLPDPFSVPFPVRISFPVAVGGPFAFRRSRLYQKFSAGLTGSTFRVIGSGFSMNEIQEAGRY